MNQSTMASYLKSITDTKLSGLNLDIAKSLIRQQVALSLDHKGVKTANLGFDILVNALLAVSFENGFIKFDANHETIQIKLFEESHVIYQYNPFRDPANRHADGQPVKKNNGQKTDFLAWEGFPKNEHYLIWQAGSGNKYGVLVQPAPIVPGHLIIASLDRDKSTQEHYPQAMTLLLLKDMHELQLSLSSIGYTMGYNAWGAGASVNHFHTQAVPASYLPIIPAINQNRVAFNYEGHDGHEVTMQIMNGVDRQNDGIVYPARAVLLKSMHYELLYERKKQLLEFFNRNKIIYNSISWHQHSGMAMDLFFPRGEEAVMNQAFKAGYVEMAGMLVMPKKPLFEAIIDHKQGDNAIAEASLSIEAFRQIEDFVKQLFKKSK